MEVYNEAVYDLLVPPNEGHEKLQIVKQGKDTVVQVYYSLTPLHTSVYGGMFFCRV